MNDKKRKIWNSLSLDENKVMKLVKESPENIWKFSNKNLVRIYPAGTRVDSSNYDSIPAFQSGGQLICLNF